MRDFMQPTANDAPGTSGDGATRVNEDDAARRTALSEVLAAAFFDDPVFDWCFPDPRRREIMPAVFRTFIDAYSGLEETYLSDDHVAGAVCAPPGGVPDDAELARLEDVTGRYAPRTFELADLLEAGHPQEPHYYVLFLGTRPEWQSRGIGSALLGQLLERCDRDGVPAYLDATSERNRPLYLRHGFEVTGEERLPEGPSFWRMWRDPR